jgi:hypothetical protein
MWRPSRAQWWVIWPIAVFLVAAWPPAEGRSLALKMAGWAVDPRHTLPVMPPELPMSLGDDGFAVAQHDTQMAEYYEVYDSSSFNRLRIQIRDFRNPFDPTTERQVLIAIAVLGALLIWRMDGARNAPH